MRIFQLCQSGEAGGADVMACELALLAQEAGYDSYIIATDPRAYTKARLSDRFRSRPGMQSVKFVRAGFGGSAIWVIVAAITFCLKYSIRKSDLLHTHTDIPDVFARIVAAISGARIVRTFHATEAWPTRPRIGCVIEWAYRPHDTITAVSHSAKEAYLALRGRFGLSPVPVEVILNGVPPRTDGDATISDSTKPLLDAISNEPDTYHIGFVGRFVLQKGVDVLIDAVRELWRGNLSRKFHLHWVGDGVRREFFESIAREEEMPITFYGNLPGVGSHLDLFDVIVLPSRSEGFCLVLLEAASCNTPVIATDIAPFKEAFGPFEDQLIPVANHLALAHALRQAIEGKWDRSRAIEAVDYIAGTFSWPEMQSAYLDLYKRYANNGLRR